MITGEGLILRGPRHEDRERWLELYADRDEQRFGMPSFSTLPDSLDAIDELILFSNEKIEAGEPASYVIAAPEDDRFLGTVGWRQESPPLEIADIGYAVHPDERGRGVATRTIRLIARWLTQDEDGPGVARVQLDHSTENVGSCRAALSAGFEQEGVRRHYLSLRDPAAPGGARRHDVCLHGWVPPGV